MFTWGYGSHAENWEHALTDSDGVYCELMAGSYSDDQPDFTYLAPFETKRFSQYWYPVRLLGMANYANLAAAVAFDREKQEVRVNVTKEVEKARIRVLKDGEVLLNRSFSLKPCTVKKFKTALPEGNLEVRITDAAGRDILHYVEKTPDSVHIPHNNPGIPIPEALKSAQDLYITGRHIDQYRDVVYKADAYYKRALEIDPEHLPSLIALSEYELRNGRKEEAAVYIDRGLRVQNRYNQNPSDGRLSYELGILRLLENDPDGAYDAFRKAAWSYNVISPAMTLAAAIAGKRGDDADMAFLADSALDKERMNPLAGPYLAIAFFRSGNKEEAKSILSLILAADPLNHLAEYVDLILNDLPRKDFFDRTKINSNASQTALDVAFDLAKAGETEEAILLLTALDEVGKAEAVSLYTLSELLIEAGEVKKAEEYRKRASEMPIVSIFPYRLSDIEVLRKITERCEDGTALYLLGCALYGRRSFEEAADCWERAIKAKPDFYIPYRNLAIACYSHLNRKDEALSWLLKAVALKPQDGQLINETSYLMAVTGVPHEARVNFMEDQLPEKPGDDLILELAKAYNAAGYYDKAAKVLAGHTFTPGEGGEIAVNDAYMFSRFAEGRIALHAHDPKKARRMFRAALEIPENLHAGFWNDSNKIPYLYYEALCLTELGRKRDAERIAERLGRMDNTGMFGMTGDFTYYEALAKRLSGDKITADKIMREAVISWEEALRAPGAMPETERKRFFYLSFIDDPEAKKKAGLYYMLGLGALYFGEEEKAKELFKKSLDLYPDNDKCALEYSLLD